MLWHYRLCVLEWISAKPLPVCHCKLQVFFFKILLLIIALSPIVVLGALFVALYFVIEEGIYKKEYGCLIQHFKCQQLLEAFNITPSDGFEPMKFARLYETKRCNLIVEEVYEKTKLTIDELPFDDCVRILFKKKPLFDAIVLWAVLLKDAQNATEILDVVINKASYVCDTSRIFENKN